MAEFLLVVEGLMADEADAAMMVSESSYLAALFGQVFDENVLGYVWCDKHGWVRSDETRICETCAWEAYEATMSTDSLGDALSDEQYCRVLDLTEQLGWDWDKAVQMVLAGEA